MSYIETKLRNIGNSRGVIIPADMLANLGLEDDAQVYISKTTTGILIMGYDPEKQKQLEIAETFLRDYDDVLRSLANK